MRRFIWSLLFLWATQLLSNDSIDGHVLIQIAKRAIASSWKHRPIERGVLVRKYPWLKQKGAVFVTLQKEGRLRGCIGSLKATQPLIDDLIANARRAAFHDPRFPPLRKEELAKLSIEVSLLSPPQPVPYRSIKDLRSKICPQKDGIILRLDGHSATYLPQVWKQLPDFDFFFAHLCTKAGLEEACLARHPKIFRYRVRSFSQEHTTRPMANAGLFYPRSCDALEEMIDAFDDRAKRAAAGEKIVPRALIAPHAGYAYSGYTADLAMRLLRNSPAKRIVVVGPSHHLYFEGISGAFYDRCATPCGPLQYDRPYLQELQKRFKILFVPKLFSKEHSTEVQMPFIRHYRPDAKVVELVYGKVDPARLAKLLSFLLEDRDNLLVLSSDLSHYYPLKIAQTKDAVCIRAIVHQDPHTLDQGCEACGLTGIRALLMAIRGAHLHTKLLYHTTSAEETGDTKSVVGYLSAVVW